jgi:glycine cleavage system H protein
MMKFTEDHEWLRVEGDIGTVGITPYAQEKLGDLVFVELPSAGAKFTKGAPAATIESVKAASDVYAPVAGEVVETNPRVVAEPGVVNADPTGEGWLFKIRIGNPAELDGLLDQQAYDKLTA